MLILRWGTHDPPSAAYSSSGRTGTRAEPEGEGFGQGTAGPTRPRSAVSEGSLTRRAAACGQSAQTLAATPPRPAPPPPRPDGWAPAGRASCGRERALAFEGPRTRVQIKDMKFQGFNLPTQVVQLLKRDGNLFCQTHNLNRSDKIHIISYSLST